MTRPILSLLIFSLAYGCSAKSVNKTDPDAPGGEPDATDGYACSRDLHAVVDAAGNEIEACAANMGCKQGQCVPACEAVAATDGNLGCEFILPTPHFWVNARPPCFTAFVANGWGATANISVHRSRIGYDEKQFGRVADGSRPETEWDAIPPEGIANGEVGVLFLAEDPQSFNQAPMTCPITPAISAPNGTAATWGSREENSALGTAWRITTDIPVSVYDIMPYGGAPSRLPSAQLHMPTANWGRNFVVTMPRASTYGSAWLQIVAREDNTSVQIKMDQGLPGGQLPAVAAGDIGTFGLDAGEYLQWQFPEGADRSGAVIISDKPIAVNSGNTYICYESSSSSGGGCDSTHVGVTSVDALGWHYVGAPHRSRRQTPESIRYRLTGTQNGTKLTFDPPLDGAPSTLELGQVYDFETTSAFTVTSQGKDFPFAFAQMMSGAFVEGAQFGNLGDEEFVSLLPPQQFLNRYVFFTDPNYGYTTLTLTRQADANGDFADVSLDCHGIVKGWQDVGSSGTHQVTTLDLTWQAQGVGNCTNGVHVANSAQPFGIVVWGLDIYASYAYPAGGNSATINPVVVPVD